MYLVEELMRDVDAVEQYVNRRAFLKAVAMAPVIPRAGLEPDDREFLRRMAATLILPEAVQATGIDIVSNVDHLLERGSAERRAKVLRLIAWARRISFLYGGDRIACQARGSRFVLMQKMAKALSSLCLLAFWGDERSLGLMSLPEVLQ